MNPAPTTPFVLLIDDNDTDNLISKRILELTGFSNNILVKNSSVAAIEWLRAVVNDQTAVMPDWIFLDINMPMLDGFDFVTAFDQLTAKMQRRARIVILSSSDSRTDIERMMKNPCVTGFITKPLTPSNLRAWQESFPTESLGLIG